MSMTANELVMGADGATNTRKDGTIQELLKGQRDSKT